MTLSNGRGRKRKGTVVDRFYAIADEMCELHYRKSLDYGTQGDTYQNFRGSAKMGIPPWKGAFIRLQDKVQRICKYSLDGKLANETVLDSFNDLAVYAIICRILLEEEQNSGHAQDREGRIPNPERVGRKRQRP